MFGQKPNAKRWIYWIRCVGNSSNRQMIDGEFFGSIYSTPTVESLKADGFFQVIDVNGRGGGIRTPDPLLPKQMRYQTALRPDNLYRL
jgi:hypothetical protein